MTILIVLLLALFVDMSGDRDYASTSQFQE